MDVLHGETENRNDIYGGGYQSFLKNWVFKLEENEDLFLNVKNRINRRSKDMKIIKS